MGCYAPYFECYAGEDKTLSLQINLFDRSKDCKEPLDLTGASAITMELPASGTTNINLSLVSTPPIVIDSAILGKIHVDLLAAQTNIMLDGSAIVKVTKAGKTIVAIATIKKLTIPSC